MQPFHRHTILVLGVLLAACGGGAPGSPSPESAAARLRVLSTNDVHGRLRPETPAWAEGRAVGGSAVLAAYWARASAEFGGPVMVVSGGDVMQGTPISNLTEGRSTVAAYNLMGYDVAAVGNHEFDWGVDVLRQRMAEAEFPWLSANIVVAGTDTAPSWLTGTAMLDVDGVRVGVLGLSTLETPEATRPSHVAGLEFRELAATMDSLVPVLRGAGADFVIVTAHAGARCDAGGTCEGEIIDAARSTRERPDLIVAGHTHAPVATRVNGIPIVETRGNGHQYTVTDLERVSRDSVAVRFRGLPIAWADGVTPDPEVAALVAGYAAELEELVERRVATLAEPLPRSGDDYALGRLIADAQRWATNAEIALMNNGGIRTALPAGTVTWGELQALQPFENELIRLELTGEQLRQAVEHSLADDGREAHVSGIRVRYDPDRPSGDRLTGLVLEDGTPVRPGETYTVTVNDFMAEGGDGFTMLTDPISRIETGIVDLDALVEYLKTREQPVRGPAEPRVRAGAPVEPRVREPRVRAGAPAPRR